MWFTKCAPQRRKKNQLTRWLRILCIFSFILRQFDHVMLFSLMCCVFCGDCISKYWGKKATQKNEKRKWKKKKLREWLCLHLTPMVSVAYLSPMEKVTKKTFTRARTCSIESHTAAQPLYYAVNCARALLMMSRHVVIWLSVCALEKKRAKILNEKITSLNKVCWFHFILFSVCRWLPFCTFFVVVPIKQIGKLFKAYAASVQSRADFDESAKNRA